jgi:prepilin-type N-terminal cleavage/methylation domain-containing protein
MRRLPRAFTLIELLMVMLIIAMITALLASAVNSARESGRRTQCLNKLRELTFSMQSYESANRQYTGYLEPLNAVNLNNGQQYVIASSWIMMLLPHIGRNDMYAPMQGTGLMGTAKTPVFDAVGNFLGRVAVPMNEKLVCPSDFARISLGFPDNPTSYVVNCGRADGTPTSSIPADWRANGVFHNNWQWGANNSSLKVNPMPASYILKYDGLDNTLLMAENLHSSAWQDLREFQTGFVFWPPNQLLPVHRINGSAAGFVVPSYNTARPSSNHPAGANVSFASGGARLLSQNIDYWVFVALMTPNGAWAQEPGTTNPSHLLIRQQPKLTPANLDP